MMWLCVFAYAYGWIVCSFALLLVGKSYKESAAAAVLWPVAVPVLAVKKLID